MKGANVFRFSAAFVLLFACCLFAVPTGVIAADAKPSLSAEDCSKCHPTPPADVAAAGGKHKSDVTCMDCHTGHRPTSKNNIPKCSSCHDGKPHYDLKGCSECHRNPHKPLSIVLGTKVTDPCLSCHTEQMKQLKENKSKHTALYCTSCHDVHRRVPECVKCHKPHSADMAKTDCKKCHKAHKPMAVTYAQDVANKDCGSCHKNAMTMLSATQTKHKTVSCVKCHKDKHKMVPQCTGCHTKLHPAAILKRFPKCSQCHSIAHDLNNWASDGAKDKAAAKSAPAPEKAEKPDAAKPAKGGKKK